MNPIAEAVMIGGLVMTILGAVWKMSGVIAKLETKVDDLGGLRDIVSDLLSRVSKLENKRRR